MSGSHSHTLVDHLFRHEAGKMIAVVVRMLGVGRLEEAEKEPVVDLDRGEAFLGGKIFHRSRLTGLDLKNAH